MESAEPIQFLNAVMNCVEFPKRGDFVESPMCPVDADIGDQDDFGNLQPDGLAADGLRHRSRDKDCSSAEDTGRHHDNGHLYDEGVEQHIDQIDTQSLAEDLLRALGEQMFERNEDQRADQQRLDAKDIHSPTSVALSFASAPLALQLLNRSTPLLSKGLIPVSAIMVMAGHVTEVLGGVT
ncbi:hypothetical protein ACVDG5_008150 [Mesorhizobium sp. ORM6]